MNEPKRMAENVYWVGVNDLDHHVQRPLAQEFQVEDAGDGRR